MTDIDVTIVLGHWTTTLQGRTSGTKHFAAVCEKLAGSPRGTTVLLDFSGVRYVTGSWLNAMLVQFFDWAAKPENDYFPLLSNVEDEWLDDFSLVAEWNHQCYIIIADGVNPMRTGVLVGNLEAAQQDSLNAVLGGQGITGAELERKSGDGVRATAWNNRLKDLYQKRLLRREKKGRQQLYFSIVKEITGNGR